MARRVVLVAAASVLALALSAANAPARMHTFDCIYQHGPTYTYTLPSGAKWAASAYSLEGFGTTCGFAKRWVKRLAAETYRGAKKPLHHGPDGWRCLADRIAPALGVTTVWKGTCQNRKDLRRVFQWDPQSGYDDHRVDPPAQPPAPEPEPSPPPEPTPPYPSY